MFIAKTHFGQNLYGGVQMRHEPRNRDDIKVYLTFFTKNMNNEIFKSVGYSMSWGTFKQFQAYIENIMPEEVQCLMDVYSAPPVAAEYITVNLKISKES
jgi:hypothetical protein